MQFIFNNFKYKQNHNIEMHPTTSGALMACDMGRSISKTTVTVLYDNGQKSLILIHPHLANTFINIFINKLFQNSKITMAYHKYNDIPNFICGLIHCFYELEYVR